MAEPESPEHAGVLARFKSEWEKALQHGSPPAVRAFLCDVPAVERDALSRALREIDEAYRRRLTSAGAEKTGDTSDIGPEATAGQSRNAEAESADSSSPGSGATIDYHAPAEAPAGASPGLGAEPLAGRSGEGQESEPASPGIPEPDSSAAQPASLQPTTGFDAARSETARQDAGPPKIPGYKITGVLGRGAMGVVYRARQQGLKRDVALKMILSGSHASQDQLARFRAEAEAVGQLQHPNIVQVYDVGEQAGLPYFSLEFVDGKSLARRIDGKPQLPRWSAELMETLARAMQYAHQRGIVHRDLKPANVLLTSEGIPKISDFGLVKRLEGDSSHTRTGTILGTPSYMAPEQGRGEKEVGPSSDVYALGSVLYELLTGRPPFLGASTMDTLMRVLSEEPLPPSRLQPKVPRDLETICLKCLQKEPRKRYATAEELADDLKRFRAGEPIMARPVSGPERVWRWCWRNPRVAIAGALAAALALVVMIGGPTAAVVINEQKRAAVTAQRTAEEEEALARQARAEAELSETAAREAEKEADAHAKATAKQAGLALGAFETLVSQVQDQLKDTPATQELRQSLLQTALDGLRKVARSAETTQIANRHMAVAHQRMGKIFVNLGATPEAMHEYEQVYAILQRLAEADPHDVGAQRNLSVALKLLGDTARLMGDLQSAQDYYTRSFTIRQALADADPQKLRWKVDLAQGLIALGNVSDLEERHDYYLQAHRLREELVKLVPEDQRARRLRDVWIARNMLADTRLQQDELVEAKAHYSESLRLAQELLQTDASSLRSKLDLALSQVNLGNAELRLEEIDAAQKHYAQATAIFGPLAEADPRNVEIQTSYALALARARRHEEAAQKAREMRELAPDNFLHLYNIACCYSLCIAAIAGDRSGDPLTPEEQRLQSEYTEEAIAALLDAVAKGLDDLDFLERDPDLASIRHHSEYRKLLAGRE